MVKGDFIDFDDELDPAVAASIGSGQRRQSQARQPAKARQKKARERTKAAARLARRVNWDLPPEIKQRIKELAAEHAVPESQIAALLLAEGLARLAAGELDIVDFKIRSDSPRYEANLAIEEILKKLV